MRNRILFLGSIIFASSVAFGETLITLPQQAVIVAELPVPFEQNIAAKLMDRGLEEQTAKVFSQQSVEDIYSAALHTQMLSNKLAINKDAIHGYIATKALYQKSVDLRAHDDVVALVQNIKGFMTQKDDLKAIQEYIALV